MAEITKKFKGVSYTIKDNQTLTIKGSEMAIEKKGNRFWSERLPYQSFKKLEKLAEAIIEKLN